MISQVLPVPRAVSETGFVRVVADATRCDGSTLSFNYDYLIVEHDPTKPDKVTPAFVATKEEVEKWRTS